MNYIKNLSVLTVLFLGLVLISGCDKEEPIDPITPDAPISSFQFEIDATDFSKVSFSNFSQNADTYAWDFGDGNSSTDENPTHSYTTAGDFTVNLEAKNASGAKSSSKVVTIVDPNSAIKDLTGETSKVWKLSRNIADEEFPCLVGPADESQIWWAFGRDDQVGSRPCMMEEEYIFGLDGTYSYKADEGVFADYNVWSDDAAGNCVDPSDASLMVGPNGEDLSAWGPGDFTFDYDASGGTLTLTGLGAHLGLAKVGTNAEFLVPQESVQYTVMSISTDGPIDKIALRTSIDGGYWQFNLVSYDNPADEPELPGATPTAIFDYLVTGSSVQFANNSVNADSYEWDFGDGNSSNEENPTHTYDADGSYSVVLTASNGNGSASATVSVVISNNSVFSLETVHGGDTKIWKLNPAAGALGVGPVKGSGEWFATSDDDVTVRDCTFDDEYIFSADNSFEYKTNGNVWAESYMGVSEDGCIDEDMLPADAAAWGSGLHTYSQVEGSGGEPFFLTVKGTGAFIALPKAFNGGEYETAPPTMDGEVMYEVLSYVNDGEKEILVLTIDISENQAGGAYWTFTLVSE